MILIRCQRQVGEQASQQQYSKSMEATRIAVQVVAVLFVVAGCSPGSLRPASCQGIKGGSSSVFSSASSSGVKGGSVAGFSRFRESINQFKQQQQQVVRPVVSQVIHQSDIRTSSVQQELRPSAVITETSRQVMEEQLTSGQADSEPAVYGSVQGVPGVDFPGYTSIPNTGFSCEGVPFEPGMYADESTGCQVYHLCYQGRRESFLCGIGTVFNQAIMNCDFWHRVDCSESSQFYQLNAEFGKSSGEPVQLQQQVAQRQTVDKTSSSSGQRSAQATSSLFSKVNSSQTSEMVPKQTFSKTSSRRGEFSRTSVLSPADQAQRLAKSQISPEQMSSVSSSKQLRPQFMFGASSQRVESTSPPSSDSIKGGSQTNEIPQPPEDSWKPYFKSKSNSTRRPSPSEVLSGLSSTPSPPPPLELTTPSGQPSAEPANQPTTVAQPDQEPSFSGSSSEVPKLPKSGTPPPNLPEMTSETTPETSIEPSVQPAAATTTTPEPMIATSEAPSEPPKESSTVEYVTTTTTTPSISTSTSGAAPETTAAPNVEVETTPAEGEQRAKKRASRRANAKRTS